MSFNFVQLLKYLDKINFNTLAQNCAQLNSVWHLFMEMINSFAKQYLQNIYSCQKSVE